MDTKKDSKLFLQHYVTFEWDLYAESSLTFSIYVFTAKFYTCRYSRDGIKSMEPFMMHEKPINKHYCLGFVIYFLEKIFRTQRIKKWEPQILLSDFIHSNSAKPGENSVFIHSNIIYIKIAVNEHFYCSHTGFHFPPKVLQTDRSSAVRIQGIPSSGCWSGAYHGCDSPSKTAVCYHSNVPNLTNT